MNEKMKEVKEKYKIRAQEEGFGELEVFVRKATNFLFDFATDFIKATTNIFDDMALAILPIVKSAILKIVDKIDGEKDA
jgi:hypothetical protein